MHWNTKTKKKPQYGDTKSKRRFLIIPRLCDFGLHYHWLEWADYRFKYFYNEWMNVDREGEIIVAGLNRPLCSKDVKSDAVPKLQIRGKVPH